MNFNTFEGCDILQGCFQYGFIQVYVSEQQLLILIPSREDIENSCSDRVTKQGHDVLGEYNENNDELNGRQSHAIVHKEDLLKYSSLIDNQPKSWALIAKLNST
jgi:hypothetical protein